MNLLSSMWKVGKPAVGSMWKALPIMCGSRPPAAVLLASPLNPPSNIGKKHSGQRPGVGQNPCWWATIGAIAKGGGHTMGAWPTGSNAPPQAPTALDRFRHNLLG